MEKNIDVSIHRGSSFVEWFAHYDDSSTLAMVEMTVSTMRPATVLGGQEQGDHVTANAVQVEWLMKILRTYIKEGANNEFESGISKLSKEIFSKINADEMLLNKLKLNNDTASKSKFNAALLDIGIIKKAAENEIKLYNGILDKMKKSDGTFNKDELTLLEKNISDVKRTYFLNVAKILATAIVEGLNADPHVTYYKIPGHEAPASEGSAVRGALNRLRKYQSHSDSASSEKAIKSVSGEVLNTVENYTIQTELTYNTQSASTNTRRSNRATRKPISLLQEIFIKGAQEQELAEIITSIKALFFFPALDHQDVEIMKKEFENYVETEQYENARTNNKEIFKLVLIRHLLDVFRTFDKLGQHSNKEDIIDGFLAEAIKDDWSNLFDQDEKKAFMEEIKREFAILSESGLQSINTNTTIKSLKPFTMTRLSLAPNKAANEVIQESSISSSTKVESVASSNYESVAVSEEELNPSKRTKNEAEESIKKTEIQQIGASYGKFKQDPNTMSSRSIVSGAASSESHSSSITSVYNTRLRSKNTISGATPSVNQNEASSNQDAEKDDKTGKNRRKKE